MNINSAKLDLLSIVFFCLIITSCQNHSKPELIEEKYSNGQVKRKYFKVNKVIQDSMWEYHNTGEIKTIYLFKDGKQHGRTTRYYKTGELEEVQYFENGLQQRSDTVFYRNGRIRFTAEMKDDKKNGLFRRWSEDKDSIEIEQLFRHDTIIIYKDSEQQ